MPMNNPAGQNEFEQRQSGPRKREPMFNMPAVVLAIIGLCVAIYLAQT